MLGIILLYWIGKYYYQLAGEYNKHQWGFTVLGIIVYYAGIFCFGFFTGIVMEIFSPGYFDDFNETLFGLLMVPFGFLSTYLLYKFLEINWKMNKPEPLINSIDLEENSQNIIG